MEHQIKITLAPNARARMLEKAAAKYPGSSERNALEQYICDVLDRAERKTRAQSVADHAKATGVVHLGGEMEFPANEGPFVAYRAACHVAEACGYVVQWKHGSSAFEVTGGDIPGSAVLDWFDPDAKELVKIEFLIPQVAYLK